MEVKDITTQEVEWVPAKISEIKMLGVSVDVGFGVWVRGQGLDLRFRIRVGSHVTCQCVTPHTLITCRAAKSTEAREVTLTYE